MRIANYMTWLTWGFNSKGLDSTSLELKVVAKRSKATRKGHEVYTGANDLNTKEFILAGLELFGSTIWKLNLPPNVDCNSH